MRLAAFIFFAVFHVVVTVIFGIFGFAVVMAAMDGEASTLAMRIIWLAWQALFFPIAALSVVVDIDGLGVGARLALLLSNSFVWAALAAMLWSCYQWGRNRLHGVPRGVPIERRGAV
jgi:hypothetical protein